MRVRRIVYGALMPFLELGSYDHENLEWVDQSVRRCKGAFTFAAKDRPLVGSERLLQDSIEGVLERICSSLADIFKDIVRLDLPLCASSLDAHRKTQDAVGRWQQNIGNLLGWLGWTSWNRCDEVCSSDEVCTPPLWPRTPPPFELPAVEYTFSNLQFLAWGGAHLAFGFSLIKAPLETLSFCSPATRYIEGLLPALTTFRAKGSEPILAIVGCFNVLLGFYAVMSVYTCDEKAKRNSVPGRFAFGLACVYVCKNTPHGSSLVALLGAVSVASSVLMALLVGPGDGNAVDLEEAEKKWRESEKLKAKAK
ncbi:hypothetical protein RQP46_007487 [Phenoliferia psychrophenolica]